MKKRIKRKIGNRIMKNIMDGRPLSKFDRKYAGQTIGVIVDRIDQRYLQDKMNVKTVKHYVDNKCVSTSVEKEHMRSFKLEDHAVLAKFETPMFLVTVNEQTQSAADAINNFAKTAAVVSPHSVNIELLSDHCSNPTITKPSKWQKVKSKVRGWFGK